MPSPNQVLRSGENQSFLVWNYASSSIKWNPFASCKPRGDDSNRIEIPATSRAEIPRYTIKIISKIIKLYNPLIY